MKVNKYLSGVFRKLQTLTAPHLKQALIRASEKFKIIFDTHIFGDGTEKCLEQYTEQEEEDIIQYDKQENNDDSPKSIQSIEQIL